MAQKQGWFARAALNVTVEAPGDLAGALAGNGGRDVDLALLPVELLVRAVDRGAALRLVAGTVNRPTASLVVGRDVADFGDLKGRALGTSDPQGLSTALLRRLLAHHGLEASQYSTVTLGSEALLASGLANGTAGAALLGPSQTAQLTALRFRTLAAAAEVAPELQLEGLAARPEWARQNEEALLRFLSVLADADAWLSAPANRAEATAILAEANKLSNAEAREIYASLIEQRQALARAAEISPGGVKNLLELLAEANPGERPRGGPEKYVDDSYISRVRR